MPNALLKTIVLAFEVGKIHTLTQGFVNLWFIEKQSLLTAQYHTFHGTKLKCTSNSETKTMCMTFYPRWLFLLPILCGNQQLV